MNGRGNGLLVDEGALPLEHRGYVVAVGLEGFEEAVERMGKEMEEMASKSGAQNIAHLADDAHRVFWDAYSNLIPKLSAQYEEMVSMKLNYPISKYLEVIQCVEAPCREQELAHVLQTHTGSGVTMVHFPLEPEDEKGSDGIVSVAEKLLEQCQSICGNLVVEKASARMKGRLPVWGTFPQDFAIMKRIKEQMDPSGLFSPGRFVGGI
jgi:glycolate oxidase FAD binding subunit